MNPKTIDEITKVEQEVAKLCLMNDVKWDEIPDHKHIETHPGMYSIAFYIAEVKIEGRTLRVKESDLNTTVAKFKSCAKDRVDAIVAHRTEKATQDLISRVEKLQEDNKGLQQQLAEQKKTLAHLLQILDNE